MEIPFEPLPPNPNVAHSKMSVIPVVVITLVAVAALGITTLAIGKSGIGGGLLGAALLGGALFAANEYCRIQRNWLRERLEECEYEDLEELVANAKIADIRALRSSNPLDWLDDTTEAAAVKILGKEETHPDVEKLVAAVRSSYIEIILS